MISATVALKFFLVIPATEMRSWLKAVYTASSSFDDMFAYFTKMIALMFTKTKRGMAFNVMSKAVDWERDDLFHVPTDALINFMVKNMSRNFVIRNDYGLYEYTTYVYHEYD